MGQSREVLILNGAALANGRDRLRTGGFQAVFRSINELAFTIETGSVSVYETVHGRDLADFGLVQIASFPSPTGTLLNAVAAYLLDQGVNAVNMEGIGAPTRLLQYVRCAQAGLLVPNVRYLPPRLLEASYHDLADELGLPFILTALRGGKGRWDFLVKDEASFAERMRVGGQSRAMFLAREFIPADISYQFLILGDELPIVIRKSLTLDQASESGTPAERCASLIDPAAFDPVARRLAMQAASLMEYDVASVDMAKHCATDEWYVLNTMATPSICTGEFIPEKLRVYSAYLRRKLRAPSEKD